MSIARTWGTRPEERAGAWPCDGWPEGATVDLYRGVTVEAPAAHVFRWLCQLRAAPYSYDWIDHAGRRSPQELTPGLEALAPGQRVMTIFRLRSFTQGRELTAETPGDRSQGLFGQVSVTYRVTQRAPGRTRLLAKLRVRPPPGLRGRVVRTLLPWGDLVMMRRQLLNLKRLAEAGAADYSSVA
jgi:hypothetical protein